MKKGADKIKTLGFDETVTPDFKPKIDIRLQHKPSRPFFPKNTTFTPKDTPQWGGSP
jgi:hypothetical protein